LEVRTLAIEVVGWSWNGAVMRAMMERGGGGDGGLFYKRTAARRLEESSGQWAGLGACGFGKVGEKADSAPRDEVDFRDLDGWTARELASSRAPPRALSPVDKKPRPRFTWILLGGGVGVPNVNCRRPGGFTPGRYLFRYTTILVLLLILLVYMCT